jgi:DNA topoisomerase-1
MSKEKGLVIVESPAKAKTIGKFLDNAFIVESSVGHIIDLPKTRFGIDVENKFMPEWVNMPGKGKVIAKLKKAAGNAATVYIATDPDREGEAIAAHIAGLLNGKKNTVHRVVFNEITRQAVRKAMASPRKIDENRVLAQQARRVLDRIVGYQISPFLWKTITKGLSAGRVQSVALRLVCEREDEIEAFKPEEYWVIDGRFAIEEKPPLVARLTKIDGKKAKLQNAEENTAALTAIRREKFTVSDVKKRTTKRKTAPPFTTSTMQQFANRLLGMSAKRTMAVAQQLYEGIEVNGETIGLITYMRTDSLRISQEASGQVRALINTLYGDDYLPDKPNYYKSKAGAQDAHEAIRPTQIDSKYTPAKIRKSLNRDQARLYELIWNRFIASQMVPAIIDKTTLIFSGGAFTFQADGEVIRFRGFLQVFDAGDEDKEDGAKKRLPENINVGMAAALLDCKGEQKFTQPPPRYSESSLVKTLDQLSIGRPSTYAQIISTILTRKYVELIEKKMHATDLGKTVNRLLIRQFPDIFNVEFTAFMENELDKIAQGSLRYEAAMEDFYEPFQKDLETANANRNEIKAAIQSKAGVDCDVCGRPMLIKFGKNGKFLACSGFPDCRNTMPAEEDKPKETDWKCPTCGAKMMQRKGKYGEFLACERYPECKTTQPVPTGVACPRDNCSGQLVQKQSRRGKIFYGCSNYPSCDYAVWDRPLPIACENCDHPFMLEKKSKNSDNPGLRCPRCKHSQKRTDERTQQSA